jgi:DNA-binding NtrC family response regulator/tetratricopeptide (TPR) repeat protein
VPLEPPITLFADRILCDSRDRAVDLATGRAVRLRVGPAASASEERAWAERCHAWYVFRHPRTPVLRDFGAVADRLRFEAIDPSVVVRDAGSRGAAGVLSTDVHPVLTRRAHILQPRAAVGRAANWLDEPDTSRLRELCLHGPHGSGLTTAGEWLAREARLRGFVPASAAWLAGLSAPIRTALVQILAHRHVVLIQHEEIRQDHARDLLAQFARLSSRPLVIVTLSRVPRPGSALLPLEPLTERELERMIGADSLRGADRRRFRRCVAHAAGWPGRFLERWSRRARHTYPVARSHAIRAAERAPAYGDELVNVDSSGAFAEEPARNAESDAVIARARDLARSGRHAAALLALKACAARLDRREASLPLARVQLALGRLLLDRGRLADAVVALDAARAAASSPSPPDLSAGITCALGHAFIGLGELKRAESLARVGLSAFPDAPTRNRLACVAADALYWQARYEEADEVLHHHARGTDPQVAALHARIALARGEMAAAGSLAHQALDLTTGASDEARLASLVSATIVSGAVADAQRARQHAGEAAALGRRERQPLWHIEARLALTEALARAKDPAAAKDAIRHLTRLSGDRTPLLLRTRVRALLAVLRPRGTDGTFERRAPAIEAVADLQAALVPTQAVTPRRRIRDTLVDLLELSQNATDDREMLDAIAAFAARAIRHAAVTILAAEGDSLRALSTTAPRPPGPPPDVASRAIALGLLVGPSRGRDGVDVAAPIRYAGATIGAMFCRWTVEGPLDWSRIEVLLSAAAVVAGPAVRGLLDRGMEASRTVAPGDLLGSSEAIAEVRTQILRAAPSPFTVLIEGESGSGKELVARAIHRASPRRDRKWCAVNCAAFSDDLLEAELFGHARGAFTGAMGDRPGLFEEASGGTLFLDEVGELTPRGQAKLLRTLQEGEVRRVGENHVRRVDVRVMAATNRCLQEEVAAGRFRQDLWYRLAVVRIMVPPLRARPEDVAELAMAFWRRTADRIGSRAALAPATVAALSRYDWPGNVRELQNTISALSVAAPRRGIVLPAALPDAIVRVSAPAGRTLDEARRAFERRFVRAAIARAGGRTAAAARELGITRQGLAKLVARLEVEAAETGDVRAGAGDGPRICLSP